MSTASNRKVRFLLDEALIAMKPIHAARQKGKGRFFSVSVVNKVSDCFPERIVIEFEFLRETEKKIKE